MNNNQSNESTVSLQSTTTVSSTTPLRQPTVPQKDYAAALGALQSRYGTGGALPNPKKEPSKKLPQTLSSVAESTPSSSAPVSTFGSSEATLATESSSVISQPQSEASTGTTESAAESSTSGSNSGSSTGGQIRKKLKEKKSILKTLLKGKKKDTDE